jgi:hypothetical protein
LVRTQPIKKSTVFKNNIDDFIVHNNSISHRDHSMILCKKCRKVIKRYSYDIDIKKVIWDICGTCWKRINNPSEYTNYPEYVIDIDYNDPEVLKYTNIFGEVDYRLYMKSSIWKQVKERIKQIYNYKCKFCGSSNELHVHHRTYDRLGHEYIDDLVVYCHHCHYEIEKPKIKEKQNYNRWKKYQDPI